MAQAKPVRWSRPRIFVAGTWNDQQAAQYGKSAAEVGRQLAEAGYDLTTGPGTGLSAYVIAGYRSVPSRGVIRTYLPRPDVMANVGERVHGELFDEVIQTDHDYPMRNVLHIRESDALLVITGGDGTFEECLPALIDYKIPTIVLKDSGTAAKALEYIAEKYYPNWLGILRFVSLPKNLVLELGAALRDPNPKTCRDLSPAGRALPAIS